MEKQERERAEAERLAREEQEREILKQEEEIRQSAEATKIIDKQLF
jgi:hypothetical protein